MERMIPPKPITKEIQLQLPDIENLSEDDDDEAQLFQILKKLKDTKTNIDSNRKKKRSIEIIDDSKRKFSKQSRDLISKHNRKWNGKHKELITKGNQFKGEVLDHQESLEKEVVAWNIEINNIKSKFDEVSHQLQLFDNEIIKKTKESENQLVYDFLAFKEEINKKMDEVEENLSKAHIRINKDDKLSKLIRAFITAF